MIFILRSIIFQVICSSFVPDLRTKTVGQNHAAYACVAHKTAVVFYFVERAEGTAAAAAGGGALNRRAATVAAAAAAVLLQLYCCCAAVVVLLSSSGSALRPDGADSP